MRNQTTETMKRELFLIFDLEGYFIDLHKIFYPRSISLWSSVRMWWNNRRLYVGLIDEEVPLGATAAVSIHWDYIEKNYKVEPAFGENIKRINATTDIYKLMDNLEVLPEYSRREVI
jgi:hypothetical protein